MAIVLLRNEYVTRGPTSVTDDVLVEIVDDVYLPLLRGRALAKDDALASYTATKRVRARKQRS